jgi:hypothetical protein
MNRLDTELHRLYLPLSLPPPSNALVLESEPGAVGGGGTGERLPAPVAGEGTVRALVLGVAKPAHWDSLAPVWQGVQADLGLPAPAIAVSGTHGHWLWFSLAEPVPLARATAFLTGLRVRYLAQLPPERVVQMPQSDGAAQAGLAPDGGSQAPGAAVPGPHAEALAVVAHLPNREVVPGQWSAFVAPDLARIFEDEPWLDRPPGPSAQADLLARLVSTPLAEFDRALARLCPQPVAQPQPQPQSRPGAAPLAAVPAPRAEGDAAGMAEGCAHAQAGAHAGCPNDADGVVAPGQWGPRRFLRGVMNDPQADMALRMEAAKLLLPFVAD